MSKYEPVGRDEVMPPELQGAGEAVGRPNNLDLALKRLRYKAEGPYDLRASKTDVWRSDLTLVLDDRETLLASHATLTAENEKLRGKVGELEAALDKATAANVEISSKIDAVAAYIDSLVTSLRAAERRVAELEAENEQIRQNYAHLGEGGVAALMEAEAQLATARRALDAVLAKAEAAYEDGELEQGALFAIREWVK